MKILVLGSNGLLGSYIISYARSLPKDIFGVSRKTNPSFDFNFPNTVEDILEKVKPNVVINCVAITSFELCEKNYEEALQVNCLAPNKIAELCTKRNIKFIHISTDHFFNDSSSRPHKETDEVQIVNNYAKTKYLAEKKIKEHKNVLILRTSIIGRTSGGINFLDWIINSLHSKERVGLYEDAYTSFIHCNQLSDLIFNLIDKDASGFFNVGCSQVFSKAQFCLLLAKRLKINLNYYLTQVKELKIPRANSCGLSSNKIQKEYGITPPSLDEVVNECILEMNQKKDFYLIDKL